MHPEAYEWVASQVAAHGPFRSALEIGSRNVNGGIRNLLGPCRYVGLDIEPGDGVDVVANGATWKTDERFDVIISSECFEHTDLWPDIVENAAALLNPDGCLIVTAAGPGRAPHSASDGGHLRSGEWYANVDPDRLWAALTSAGLSDVTVDVLGADVRAVAFAR